LPNELPALPTTTTMTTSTQCRKGEFVSNANANLPTSSDDLRPIPLPTPFNLSSLPNTGYCNWSFNNETRVLLADFRNAPQQQQQQEQQQSMEERQQGGRMNRNEVHIERADEIFLLHMMEKDDITVISEGLADTINPSFWEYDYIDDCIGSEYHHKFRSFIEGREKDGWYSMKFSDYFRYLERRQVVKKMNSGSGGESTTMVNDESPNNTDFTFSDSYGMYGTFRQC
jgi:hypothetical protein